MTHELYFPPLKVVVRYDDRGERGITISGYRDLFRKPLSEDTVVFMARQIGWSWARLTDEVNDEIRRTT